MFGTRVVGLLLASTAAHAGTFLTVPQGLNPGDTYRLAFVSSETTDATSTDITTYIRSYRILPTRCWRSNAVSAVDNIAWQSATGEIYGLDGTLV